MVKVAKKMAIDGSICPLPPFLAKKLENGLKTKNPRKSKNYKGIMWWPGIPTCATALSGQALLNRRNLSRRRVTRSVGTGID